MENRTLLRGADDTGISASPLGCFAAIACSAALLAGCGTKTTAVTVTRVTTVVERVAAPTGAILMPRRDGELVYRPSEIALSDSFALIEVHWQSFGKRHAVGRGTYDLNACEPTCATAPRDKVAAEIDLMGRVPCHGRLAYKLITIEGPGMKVRDEPIAHAINATRPAC